MSHDTEGKLTPQEAAAQTFSVCHKIDAIEASMADFAGNIPGNIPTEATEQRAALYGELHSLIEYTAYSPVGKQRLVEIFFSSTDDVRKKLSSDMASTYFHQESSTDLGIFDTHTAQISEMYMLAEDVVNARESAGISSRRNLDASEAERQRYSHSALLKTEVVLEWIRVYNFHYNVTDVLSQDIYKENALGYNVTNELKRLQQELEESAQGKSFEALLSEVLIGEKIEALEAVSALILPSVDINASNADMFTRLVIKEIDAIARSAFASSTTEELVNGKSDMSKSEREKMFKLFGQLYQMVDFTALTEYSKKMLRESLARVPYNEVSTSKTFGDHYFWIRPSQPRGVFNVVVAAKYELYEIAREAVKLMDVHPIDSPRYEADLRAWIDEYNNHYGNLLITGSSQEGTLLARNAQEVLNQMQESLTNFVSSGNAYADELEKNPMEETIKRMRWLLLFLKNRN